MTENANQWKRPEDFISFRTSDPKEMLGKYLASRVIKTWNEDFIDEDTKEIVSIERNELLHERGLHLTQDLVQQIRFEIESEEIKDVEVCDHPFIKAERFITPSMTAFIVVLHYSTEPHSYVVRAQNIETAIKVATDFANVYRTLRDVVSPIKVTQLGCGIIDDDDDCIPEDERLPLEDKKQYFKVSVRLTYYNESKAKMENEDSTCIINADEVGQAKDRVYKFGIKRYEDVLKDNPENTFKVRKAVPFDIEALVPRSYSEMYRQEPT